MKNDITTTFLNFVLAVLVVLCVVFAILYLQRTQKARQLQSRLQMVQINIGNAEALARDAALYNQTARNPELSQILQRAMGSPAPAPAPTK
jgi:Flp pilus assembly protein TadB